MAPTKSNSPSLYPLASLLALLLIIHNCSAARVLLLNNAARSDPAQQAQTAIAESLSSARRVSALVSSMAKSGGLKAREAAAVKDCMATVGDSVEELQRSLQAMKSARGGSRSAVTAQVEDVQTWVSAALTDEDTCMDGFTDKGMDGEAKRKIRGEIVKVAQLISNALALLRRCAH